MVYVTEYQWQQIKNRLPKNVQTSINEDSALIDEIERQTKTHQQMENKVSEPEKVKNICPYCGKEKCIPEVAFGNASAYGSRYFKLCCVHCHGAILVSLMRTVYVDDVRKGDHKVDDWGEIPKHFREKP